jgi:hypothetical protein
MNLPKQSRPVIREVSRDPIGARVEGAQLMACLNWCAANCNPHQYAGCEMRCHGGLPPAC